MKSYNFIFFILLLLFDGCICLTNSSDINEVEKLNTQINEINNHNLSKHHGVQVASFRWETVRAPLVLTMFIAAMGLFKVVYHTTGIFKDFVPESCCLIILGMILGFFFLGDSNHENIKFLEFDSNIFFFYLLPPIIFESAYSLKDSAFIDNLGTILLYAVLGTILNIAIIGGGLVALDSYNLMGDFKIDPLDAFLFASLIAAVDPVAVLAIFKELGVNKMLYFMVFGESLLNDAVTVVCYNLVTEFKELPEITLHDIGMGAASFICVSIGGFLIGLFYGILSSFFTMYTDSVRVVEPIICFGLAYLSYMSAELFHWSGIIAIIVCGLFQAHYTVHNLSHKSTVTINTLAHVSSTVTESLIFIILGVMVVNEENWIFSDFHLGFSIAALIFCLFARFIIVFILTTIVNQFTGGVRYISRNEQIIMFYGGLRSAISFSLAFSLDNNVQCRGIILSATYVVIFFTVFIQGGTIKFLVKYLNIRLSEQEENFKMFIEFNKCVVDHFTECLEEICGKTNNSIVQYFRNFSQTYLRKYIQKGYIEAKIAKVEKMVQINKESIIGQVNSGKTLSRNSSFGISDTNNKMLNSSVNKETRPMIDNNNDVEINENMIVLRRNRSSTLTNSNFKSPIEIRKLIAQNTPNDFYIDKNMVNEDEEEERIRIIKERIESANIFTSDMTERKKKRNMFGIRKKDKQKFSIGKGLLASGIGSVAISSNQTIIKNNSVPSIAELELENGKNELLEKHTDNSSSHASLVDGKHHLQTIQSVDEEEKITNNDDNEYLFSFVEMEFKSFSKKPKNAEALFKKFASYNFDEKIENFMRFLNDFNEYDNKEIPLHLDDKQVEIAYNKLTFERDKAHMRVLLLGQLIENDKLKELLSSDHENADKYEIIYQKIVSLKRVVETIENVTSSEYPDLCSFIIPKLRYQLYDDCLTKFNICDKITSLINEYRSENRIESSRINSLSKNDRDLIYIEMSEKFHSAVSLCRFSYVEKPEGYQKALEIEKTIISGNVNQYTEDEERENSCYDEECNSSYDEEDGSDYDKEEIYILDGESEINDSIGNIHSVEVNESRVSELLTNSVVTGESSKSLKRPLEADSEIEIVGYGKCLKFNDGNYSNQDEIECIVISDDE
uniref:Sodium/hydrogen exchanger n=1 Tax=Strongyloides stercoralis TaxID=6248 RepID=A0AAF5HXN1_STRER